MYLQVKTLSCLSLPDSVYKDMVQQGMPEQKTAPQRISQVLLQRFFTLTNCGCSKLLNNILILSTMYIFQSICLI